MITIYKPGTKTLVGNIEVLILAVNITDSFIPTYQVCWWDALERKTTWITQVEINLNPSYYTEIGFKT